MYTLLPQFPIQKVLQECGKNGVDLEMEVGPKIGVNSMADYAEQIAGSMPPNVKFRVSVPGEGRQSILDIIRNEFRKANRLADLVFVESHPDVIDSPQDPVAAAEDEAHRQELVQAATRVRTAVERIKRFESKSE